MSNPKSKIQNPNSQDLCRLLFETASDAILVLQQGQIVDCNASAATLFGCLPEEVLGQTLLNFSPSTQADNRDSKEALSEKMEAALSGQPQRFEWVHQRSNGETFYAQIALNCVEFNNDTFIRASILEVFAAQASAELERRQAESELQYRIEFERLITTISTQFVNLTPDELDNEMNRALQNIGEFANVDRSYIFLFSDDGHTADNTHEWCAEGIEPQIQELQGHNVDELPWLAKLLRQLEVFYFPTVADLPPEAAIEKEFFQELEILSLVVVPMVYGGSLIGFLGFDSVRQEKTWTEDSMTLLRLVGEIFANALERVQASEALQESEARLRMIIETSLDAVVGMDENGVINEWSSQAEKVFGWTYAEAVGQTVAETIIPPQYRESHARGLAHFIKTGEGSVLNQRIKITASHRDGYEFPVELTISPFRQGDTWLFSSFIRDISGRKQQEEELRKLSWAVEQSASSVVITDARGNIDYVNPRFTQLTGYTSAEVIGQNPSILKSGQTPPEEYAKMWNAITAGGEWLGEFHNKKKSGELYWVSASISPVRDPEGNITHFLGVEEDITERKQLEQQIQNSLERRGRQVQISTQISQEVATVTIEQELYERAVTLIKEQFGFYHVQLFRYDPVEQRLNLVAGYGEIGVQMLTEGYQVPLGISLVGMVAANRASILQPDVVNDPNWRPYPLLPEVKCELAAPIKLGREDAETQVILGVLAVQSDAVDALDAEDQLVLEGLAGQIAVAIENIRLLEEANIFRQFAEAAGQGMGFATLEGNVIYFNPTFGRILDDNIENALGKPMFSYFPEEALQRLHNEVLPAVMEQGQWSGELLLCSTKGRLIPTIQNYSLLRDQNGAPQYIASVVTDITEQKQTEDELEVRLRELNALQRLMSREGWQAFTATNEDLAQGYLFDQTTARPVTAKDIENGQIVSQASPDNNQNLTRSVAVYGEIIGQIGVYDDPDHPLDIEDQEFLDSVAEQVAEALERARLLEQTQKRATELEAVAQVSTVASTTLDVQEMLQTVVDLTKSSFDLYHAHIYLLNEARNALVLTAGAGKVGRQMVSQNWNISLDQENSLVARSARSRQGFIANDVYTEPDFLPNPLLPHTRSELAAPLIIGEQALGVLDVQAQVVNRFTEDDVRIQTTLAAQVAVALENARLFEAQRQAANEIEIQAYRLAMLNELGAELKRTTDVDEILNITATKANAIINTKQASIGLLNETGDKYELYTLKNLEGASLLSSELPVEGTHARLAMQQKRALVVPDIRGVDFIEFSTLIDQGLRSAMTSPLIAGGKIMGVISVNSEMVNAFIEQDEALFTQIASLLATTIESRRLLEETNAALAEMARLYEAARRINETTDVQEIVAAIAEGGAVSTINRMVLHTYEYNLMDDMEASVVVANWYSGQGTPPTAPGRRYLRTEFILIEQFLSRTPVFFNDVAHDDRIDPTTHRLLQQLNVKTMVSLPLWVGLRQTGVLLLQTEEIHHFTLREIQPYLTLVDQATVAIENQRLLEETNRALAESEAAQRRYTLQTWADYRDKATIYSYEEQTLEETTPIMDEIPPEAQAAVTRKQTVVVQPSARLTDGTDQMDGNGQALTNATQSGMSVPLMVRGEVVGVLGLQDADDTKEWFPEEIALVEAIAEQIAQAAENIRLIDETQLRAARERRTNEIGDKIQAAQSLEEALQIAVREVGLSLQVPQTTIQLEVKQEWGV